MIGGMGMGKRHENVLLVDCRGMKSTNYFVVLVVVSICSRHNAIMNV